MVSAVEAVTAAAISHGFAFLMVTMVIAVALVCATVVTLVLSTSKDSRPKVIGQLAVVLGDWC